MTDEAKKIVDALRCEEICDPSKKCLSCDYHDAERYCDADRLYADSADMIERLSEELECVKRERDAAVNDLYEAVDKGSCNVCDSTDCEACDGVKSHFKWRDVCEENCGGAE